VTNINAPIGLSHFSFYVPCISEENTNALTVISSTPVETGVRENDYCPEGDPLTCGNPNGFNGIKFNYQLEGSGPSVFYDLDQLSQGDTVTVTDDTGEMCQFVVVDKKRYPYDTTALDDVFGPTSKQRLNLITCIGEFDQNAGTHSERLVVFTEQLN